MAFSGRDATPRRESWHGFWRGMRRFCGRVGTVSGIDGGELDEWLRRPHRPSESSAMREELSLDGGFKIREMRSRWQQEDSGVVDFELGVRIDRGDALEGIEKNSTEGAGLAIAVPELK